MWAKLFFLSLTLTWVIDTWFEKLIPQIGDWIWKTPSAHDVSWLAISCNACLLFWKILSGDLFFDVLIIGLFSIYVFKDQIHGEEETSWLKPRLLVTLGSNKCQTQFSTGNIFLGKFDPKNRNCQFQMKFGTRLIWICRIIM